MTFAPSKRMAPQGDIGPLGLTAQARRAIAELRYNPEVVGSSPSPATSDGLAVYATFFIYKKSTGGLLVLFVAMR